MDINNKDNLTLDELSAYLGWSTRYIEALIDAEQLPLRNSGGINVFNKQEIIDWLDQKIQNLEDHWLAQLESRFSEEVVRPASNRLTNLLDLKSIAVDVKANTREEIVSALVRQAVKSGKVKDPETLQQSILEREALCSTAMPGGVAICHPRRPDASVISDFLLVMIRTEKPVAFGSPDGKPTGIFFLLCAPDDATHLHSLSRLARILDSMTLAQLNHLSRTSIEVLSTLEDREIELLDHDSPKIAALA